jgi:hypothetical protein
MANLALTFRCIPTAVLTFSFLAVMTDAFFAWGLAAAVRPGQQDKLHDEIEKLAKEQKEPTMERRSTSVQ